MKIQLYYYSQCPFCVRVLKAIDRLNLQDLIELKNTLEDPTNRKFHVKKTGRTTVPCLYIDDEPLFESGDIVRWLEANKDSILKEA